MKSPAAQQFFHHHLHIRTAFSDQFIHQAVGTGVCPVGGGSACIQKIDNGPWIVNLLTAAKDKAVIPRFYFFFPLGQTELIQRREHLLFRKSKTVPVLFGSDRHYFQIIQIRKHGFPAHPGNSRHDRTLQIRVGFKCGIEHASDKVHQLLPVSMNIRFLHGRIVFVQKNDHFFPIITAQVLR